MNRYDWMVIAVSVLRSGRRVNRPASSRGSRRFCPAQFCLQENRMTSLIHTWGTQPHERALTFPCSQLIPAPDDVFYRGITIQAQPHVVFRWLSQMRVAPYNYDWIDNLGRKSPRRLTPGLDDLATGQEVMQIFELVDFARDQHLTLRLGQHLLPLLAVYCFLDRVETGAEKSPRRLRSMPLLFSDHRA
jgi:hypothetical protein